MQGQVCCLQAEHETAFICSYSCVASPNCHQLWDVLFRNNCLDIQQVVNVYQTRESCRVCENTSFISEKAALHESHARARVRDSNFRATSNDQKFLTHTINNVTYTHSDSFSLIQICSDSFISLTQIHPISLRFALTHSDSCNLTQICSASCRFT